MKQTAQTTQKYYTFKNIDIISMYLSQNQKNKNRAILRIATENGTKSKASSKKFEIAKKLYNSIKKLNKLREFELEFDSIFKTVERDFYSKKQDQIYKKISPLAKALNIQIYCGTWWHLCTNKNQDIYF